MTASFYQIIVNNRPLVGALLTLALAVAVARAAYRAYQDASKLDAEQRNLAERLLDPVVKRVAPRTDVAIRELKKQLQMAGLRDDGAVTRFTLFRIGSMVVGGAAGLAAFVFFEGFTTKVGIAAVCFIVGYQAPMRNLQGRIADRQYRISTALPSLVDLLVLCLDVGLSIESAFDRVTQEIMTMEPLLGEESQVMLAEINAGVIFPQALRRMAERIGLEELLTLARLISQANALGASVTQALREYSDASFQRRLMSLEEQAGIISAKMIIPVSLMLLPAALLAFVGPAIIMVVANIMER